MPGNSFGQAFTFTTWGESHGPEIGCVVDGVPPLIELSASPSGRSTLRPRWTTCVPAGSERAWTNALLSELSEADLQQYLDQRKPGQSRYTTQRKEPDQVQIVSGVFEGKTTGTPIGLIIENQDQRSKDYGDIKDKFRPGHADVTYWAKYASRRSSARTGTGIRSQRTPSSPPMPRRQKTGPRPWMRRAKADPPSAPWLRWWPAACPRAWVNWFTTVPTPILPRL